MPDGESQVIEWAENNSATHEILIESPLGSVYDSDNLVRGLSLVGLSSYDSGMRTVSLTSGELLDSGSDIPEVMLDEGAMNFLGWKVGEIQTIQVNGDDIDVKITGITRGEISRTVYFDLGDLSSIMGVNATSVYLQLPDGVVVDSQLGQISTGVVERQTLLNGIESLIEQQTQIFQSIMYLGLLFTLSLIHISEPTRLR